MLQIKDLCVTLTRDGRKLTDGFSFSLLPGDRAALIGEEGDGKSTLLRLIYDPRLISGYAEYTGTVVADGRLGYLPQELTAAQKEQSPARLLSEALEKLGPAEAAALADRLGIDRAALASPRPLSAFSGGEKVKLQLFGVLADGPDMLLLDEPTNDVDLETLLWLEKWINGCGLPVLYVSHDETLLENTANVIIHLEQLIHKREPRFTVARVGYREYVRRRAAEQAHTGQVARKQRVEYDEKLARWREIHDKVERDQRNISRADPGGGRLLKKKMKAVMSQQRRFEREKEDFLEIPVTEDAALIKFSGDCALPARKEVLRLRLPELTVGDRRLAAPVELTVFGGEHAAITGANGCGKTTLMRIIARELLARPDLRAAYMPQDYAEALDPEQTPVKFLCPAGDRAGVCAARIQLGSMRFTPDEMLGKIGALSGGQKAKLLLVKMTLEGKNTLLLDEPTRNFSPLSNPVIRQVLRDFPGTVISVSHDRKFLAECFDKIYELTPDGLKLTDAPGGQRLEKEN